MFSHLLIAGMSYRIRRFILRLLPITAARNPGGKKPPQDSPSTHPTPNINRLRETVDLSDEATTKRSQQALKELVCNFHP
jgi:hypothetical protein